MSQQKQMLETIKFVTITGMGDLDDRRGTTLVFNEKSGKEVIEETPYQELLQKLSNRSLKDMEISSDFITKIIEQNELEIDDVYWLLSKNIFSCRIDKFISYLFDKYSNFDDIYQIVKHITTNDRYIIYFIKEIFKLDLDNNKKIQLLALIDSYIVLSRMISDYVENDLIEEYIGSVKIKNFEDVLEENNVNKDRILFVIDCLIENGYDLSKVIFNDIAPEYLDDLLDRNLNINEHNISEYSIDFCDILITRKKYSPEQLCKLYLISANEDDADRTNYFSVMKYFIGLGCDLNKIFLEIN